LKKQSSNGKISIAMHSNWILEKLSLAKEYWQNFIRRTKSKKAFKFDVKRAEWCMYSNMFEMYNKIYKDFCSAGVACEHPEHVWRNENGDIVEKERGIWMLVPI
jgi:hypothetical protein